MFLLSRGGQPSSKRATFRALTLPPPKSTSTRCLFLSEESPRDPPPRFPSAREGVGNLVSN